MTGPRVRYVVLMLFSAAFSLQASDTLRLKRSSWGISISPDHSYRTLDYSSSAQWIAERRNKQEAARLGYTFGINYSRRISEKLSLDAGFLFSDRGMKTHWKKLEWMQTDATYPQKSKTVFHYNYISIPVRLHYYFSIKRMQVFVSGGLATDLFLQQRVVLRVEQSNGKRHREKSPEPDVYSKLNLSALVSAGIILPLSERLSLRIEPVLRRSLTPVLINVADKEYHYSAGLNASVFLRMKHKDK